MIFWLWNFKAGGSVPDSCKNPTETKVLPGYHCYANEKFGNFWHYGAKLCKVVSNWRLIGFMEIFTHLKCPHLFAIFGGFVYDNLKWYLMGIEWGSIMGTKFQRRKEAGHLT